MEGVLEIVENQITKKKNNVNFFTGENFIDTEKFNFYIQMYFENQMKCHYKISQMTSILMKNEAYFRASIIESQ